ncbi:EF hand [Sphingobium faniae]|nr:EF hand [Sphingobium faniae]
MIRKFMMTVAAGALLTGGLAASHIASAQDGPGRGGPRGGMMMADANKDGNLTKAELTASLEARFAKMDANKDGKLTKEDRELRRQQRQEARFAQLDTDKNGQISKAEFTAGHDRRADAGKPDGQDGRHWGGRHHRGFGKGMMPGGRGAADGAKDGTLTRDQFVARGMAMFDRADANKDGTVTAEEMKAAHQAMRKAWQDRKGAAPAAPAN